jgi:hypothetical protein
MSPKLHKRSTVQKIGVNDNWPLPAPEPEDVDEEKRPQISSDTDMPNVNSIDPATDGRPDIGTGQSTATGLADVDLSTVTQLKKKKKFGMLRRALRLDD